MSPEAARDLLIVELKSKLLARDRYITELEAKIIWIERHFEELIAKVEGRYFDLTEEDEEDFFSIEV